MAAPNQPPNGTRKSINGFITKLVGDGGTFGFINDEIFFQQDVVVGGPAAINDRVFAECEYSENLPIKWNATSIKVIQKANASPGGPAPAAVATSGGVPDPHDSDPRRVQGLMNQQQASPLQQPFNQPPPQPVANTYQQHRQQRQQQQQQQQQLLRPPPFETMNQADNSSHQQPMRMLDQPNIVAPDYYSNPAFPQPLAHDIPPFQQHDPPMGPPKITYTSQLGAAFVQNQGPLVPPPFIAQPNSGPQTMLPSQQQQNNQQQRSKQNRFGNQINKSLDHNNRQLDNRNRNRNDGHRSRDQDRDSRNSQNDSRNRSSKTSRDRSSGRSSSPRQSSRPSPPSHHPIRSRASESSERSGSHSTSKGSKRHSCEAHNIPKNKILTNLNGWNLRSRCSSSVHVPSDLKDVIVNKYFRLDVKNTPKPIQYNIEPSKSIEKESITDGINPAKKESTENTQDSSIDNNDSEQETATTKDGDKSENIESSSIVTPQCTQSKSDIKLNHKYGVKVILLSIPELETIYKHVFGNELDSFSNESSRMRPKLDESISVLCNEGPNGGHSLIGGKFDPTSDGFIEGEKNEFERQGRQPDLIATCRRVVLEQAGLDLGPCKSWTLLSTFVYNNKTDYFSPKASVEYSYIYMPQIWTMAPMDRLEENKSILEDTEEKKLDVEEEEEKKKKKPDVEELEQRETEEKSSASEDQREETIQASEQVIVEAETTSGEAAETGLTVEQLSDLKVVDLKLELDRRFVKYKPNAKKAELVALLHQYLQTTKQQSSTTDATPLKPEAEPVATDNIEAQQQEIAAAAAAADVAKEASLVSGEQAGSAESNEPGEVKYKEDNETDAGDQSNKRKALDNDDNEEGEKSVDASVVSEPQDHIGKKICLDSYIESEEKVEVRKEKVELIKEPFVVKARNGPQQLVIVSLGVLNQVSRYDQFELSISSYLLKESLIQHLSEYILTALVEDSGIKVGSTIGEPSVNGSNQSSGSVSSGSISQDTNNSDTNNNTSGLAKANKTAQGNKISKEYPVDRYINLACAYFDSTHVGYLYLDDLSKLFNNSGLTISKRALISLIGDGEKFNYRTLADLSPKLAPTYVYSFPSQFYRLPGCDFGDRCDDDDDDDDESGKSSGKMVQYQGVRYDLESLIRQVREAETMRVSMVERFNYAIENFDKQTEEIHVLEVNQKSLSNAIKAQNDEIGELKRERDTIKKKFDALRKGIKSSVGSLNDLLAKEEKS